MSTFETAHMDRDDRPIEECGVIGVSSPAGEQTAQLAFFGLFALQHRGQEAAGIKAMTSVSLVAVSPKPRCKSSSRNSAALIRLPLCARASVPCIVSNKNGCAF